MKTQYNLADIVIDITFVSPDLRLECKMPGKPSFLFDSQSHQMPTIIEAFQLCKIYMQGTRDGFAECAALKHAA